MVLMLTTRASWNDRVQKEGEFKQQRPGNTHMAFPCYTRAMRIRKMLVTGIYI